MKITKKQLKTIIKEELLSEMKPADMSMADAAEYYDQQRASGPAGVQLSNDLFEELLEYLEDMAGFKMKGGGFVASRGRELLAKVQKEVGTK